MLKKKLGHLFFFASLKIFRQQLISFKQLKRLKNYNINLGSKVVDNL
jgi:hypothetical protein